MDNDKLALAVGQALQARGLYLCTAESCTGGGVACALTDIAGSSAWFDRGFVTYSNQAKIDMLGVSLDTLREHGAVSIETVREMAMGALAKSHSQVAVAVSGIAGPGGGSIDKPVGMVCFAWALADLVEAKTFFLQGDRAQIRKEAVAAALAGVLAILQTISVGKADGAFDRPSV